MTKLGRSSVIRFYGFRDAGPCCGLPRAEALGGSRTFPRPLAPS